MTHTEPRKGADRERSLHQHPPSTGRNAPPDPARRAVKRLRRVLGLLTLALLGATVGYAVAELLGPAAPDPGVPLPLLLLALPVVVFGVLFIHECGHLLGGRVAGFRFVLLVVGPLELTRAGGGVRLALNKNPALYGGIAGSVPPGGRDLRRKMAVYVAGGPLASLALGITALLAASGLPGDGAFPLGITGLVSLVIAVVTLLPTRLGGFVSDGARLLMLLRGGPEAERWCGLAAIYGASMGGTRPRDWPASWVARATALPDDTLDGTGGRLLAYARALDTGDAAGAGRLLDHSLGHLEGLPAAFRPSVMLEAAYYTARHRNDPATARAWLDRAKGGMMVERHTRLRVEAAVLLAEGRSGEAAERAGEGLRLASRSWDPGGARAEEDWLREIPRMAAGDAGATDATAEETAAAGRDRTRAEVRDNDARG